MKSIISSIIYNDITTINVQYTCDKHGDIAVYFCILYSPRIYLRLGLSFATLIRAVIETKSGRSRRKNLIEWMGISD